MTVLDCKCLQSSQAACWKSSAFFSKKLKELYLVVSCSLTVCLPGCMLKNSQLVQVIVVHTTLLNYRTSPFTLS